MENFSPFWSRLADKNPNPPKLAFADGTDVRVQNAVRRTELASNIRPVLVGDPEQIRQAAKKAGIQEPDPSHFCIVKDPKRLAHRLAEKQAKQNVGEDAALAQLNDSLYMALALLLEGEVDGVIAGSLRPTADVVRAALQCVGTRPGQRLVAGHFLLESSTFRSGSGGPFLLADCAVMPEPSPRSLASIAVSAAESYKFFTGDIAKVALLSFSTRGSAKHELVDRIVEAKNIVNQSNPGLLIDAELQADAALDPVVARIKGAGDSTVAGNANVLIFPNLESGNIGYKLVQRFATIRVAGPLLWGLARPVSDLSRGCTEQEIADTALCVSRIIRG